MSVNFIKISFTQLKKTTTFVFGTFTTEEETRIYKISCWKDIRYKTIFETKNQTRIKAQIFLEAGRSI